MYSDKFQKYDHGSANNLIKYPGNTTPPEYNLTKVTSPVVIFHSQNDVFATVDDVLKSIKLLPNLRMVHLVEDELFTHVDFTYAKDADKLVYQQILEIMISDENEDCVLNKCKSLP